jgi:hypothetical protein
MTTLARLWAIPQLLCRFSNAAVCCKTCCQPAGQHNEGMPIRLSLWLPPSLIQSTCRLGPLVGTVPSWSSWSGDPCTEASSWGSNVDRQASTTPAWNKMKDLRCLGGFSRFSVMWSMLNRRQQILSRWIFVMPTSYQPASVLVRLICYDSPPFHEQNISLCYSWTSIWFLVKNSHRP